MSTNRTSSENQSFLSRINPLESKLGRKVALATTLAFGATTLAACGGAPTPVETSQAQEQTPKPNPEATKTPEAPAPEVGKFTGTIDLAVFTGEAWTNHESAEQHLACDAFFDANIENRAALSLESTAQEIAQSHKDKMLLLQSLAADRSDPLNYEAANNIANCIAANLITNDGGNAAVETIQEELKAVATSSIEGVTVGFIEPDQIVRHSDGTFPGQTDASDTYSAYAIQGYMNDGIGNQKGTLAVEYYKWVPDTQDYDLVLRTPLYDGVTPDFGPNPPVEVQQ